MPGRQRADLAARSAGSAAAPPDHPAHPASSLFRHAARAAQHAPREPEHIQIRPMSGYLLALIGAAMALVAGSFFTLTGMTRITALGRIEADGPHLRATLLAPVDAARLVHVGDALPLHYRHCAQAACPPLEARVVSVSRVPGERMPGACGREAADYRIDVEWVRADPTTRSDIVQADLALTHRRPLYQSLLASLACRPARR